MFGMKLSLKAPTFVLDEARLQADLAMNMSTLTKQAAAEFVKAAIVKVPIDTGQARGTFLPLGRAFNIPVPITGAKPRENKNEDTGASADKKFLFQFSGNQYGYFFEFEPQLFYYWYNDFFGASGHSPWGSMEAGIEAFVKFMRQEAPNRVPKLMKYVKQVDIDFTFDL